MAETSGSMAHARPADHGAALVNPGMGWVFHHYDNGIGAYGSRLEPHDTLDDFPGLAAVYLRLGWMNVEPREGEFDWSIVDTPAQRWIDKGKRVGLRFTASEFGGDGLPPYVREAGAKGYFYEPGKGVIPDPGRPTPFWEVDYEDPIFLDKLDRFLAVLASRYDGDPTVEFLDVGSFGVWGEGHNFWSTKRDYSARTIVRHIDLHRKHFKHTLLVANDDFADHGRGEASLEHSLKHGLALRDDSVLAYNAGDNYRDPQRAQPFWPSLPVIVENEHWPDPKDPPVWRRPGLVDPTERWLDIVETYHASYASFHWWPREFLQADRASIDAVNRRLGYRLRVVEAKWSAAVRPGGRFHVVASWANAGVAPCLPGGHPAYTLENEQGGIVAVLVDDALDVRSLPVGPASDLPNLARLRDRHWPVSPNVRPGRYTLYASVGTRTGTPKIALPHDHTDGHRRYRLGTVEVT